MSEICAPGSGEQIDDSSSGNSKRTLPAAVRGQRNYGCVQRYAERRITQFGRIGSV